MSRSILAALLLLLATIPDASAQILNCGGTWKDTALYQTAPGLKRVTGLFSTSRDFSLCPLMVRVEGWVHGAGGAGSNEDAYSAFFSLDVTVPNYGPRGATGRHWLIELLPPWYWFFLGETYAETWVDPPPDDGGGDDDGYHECGGGCECYPGDCSPILVDTDFDGYHLTGPDVMFDLDADGTPERVSWTRVGQDGRVDAWLAYDWNGNGTIDSGAELFGNETLIYPNTPEPTARNGFEALGFMESALFGRSVSDGKIDRNDFIWPGLLLWHDSNHNGLSEPDELTKAQDAGLLGISLEYRLSKRRDGHGNEFRQRGTCWWSERGRPVARPIFDVWLVRPGLSAPPPQP